MKQQCETAILNYAPVIRQTNAYLFNEHKDYIVAVITLYRDHYHALKAAGETEWRDLDSATITWLDDNKPY